MQRIKANICEVLLVCLIILLLQSCHKNNNLVKITILHTNDTHSQLEPLPENHPRFPLMGGVARRAFIIDSIRQQEKNVLVFDCGDFSQGTPYYNLFKGEPEVLLMNKIAYDAATLGNHEFDYGLDNLVRILKLARFPVVSANYQSNAFLPLVSPYQIIEKDGIRIGVFGIGAILHGLVPDNHFQSVTITSPLATADSIADELRNNHHCQFIICLSHLGLESEDEVNDIALAQNTSNIDLIIGGHSHTPLENGKWVINRDKRNVLIAQAGYSGVSIGKIDIYINKGATKYNKKR